MSVEYTVNIGYKIDSAPLQRAASDIDAHTQAAKANGKASSDAAKQVNAYGMSHKQNAAAMRGVPAQITDITTSLLAGQNPMMVMLQQGGQLKDMFGGIRPAAAALGSQLLALVNPYTVAAAGAAALGYAFWKLTEDSRNVAKNIKEIESAVLSLKTSGVFAITTGEISAFVKELDKLRSYGVSKGELSDEFKAIVQQASDLNGMSVALADKIANIRKLSDEAADGFLKMYEASMKNTDATGEALINAGYLVGENRKNFELAQSIGNEEGKRVAVQEALNYLADEHNKKLVVGAHWSGTEEQLLAKIEKLKQRIAVHDDAGDARAARIVSSLKDQLSELEKIYTAYTQLAGVSTPVDARLAQNAAAVERAEKERDDIIMRYGTLRQQREIELARTTAEHTQRIEASKKFETSATALAIMERNFKLEIDGINNAYNEREARASRADKSEERRLARLVEMRKRYEMEIADARAKYAAQGSATSHEIAVIDDSPNIESANRRIEVLRAEREAYTALGFTMNGYVEMGDGVRLAAIEMTKSKALELGIIKNLNDEIDTGSKKYQEWANAARAAAGEAVDTAIVQQQKQVLSTVKQITQANAANHDYQLLIKDLLASGVVPGSEKWETSVMDINTGLRAQQLILQGIDAAQAEIIAKSERQTEQTAKDNERAGETLKRQQELMQSWRNSVNTTLGSAFDEAWNTGRVSFKELLSDLLRDLTKSMFLKMMMNFMTGNGFNMGTYADGGAFKAGGVQFFANGGVVSRPTAFGMSGGKMGVMGEAGPEAIMPLKRGRNGQLGVQANVAGTQASIVVAPGAVVVNASKDSAEDAAKTAQAIDRLLNEKITKYMRDQMRPGNSLNPNFRQRY